ncbi:MAG: sigma-70 family RNA polymerase sigma factor [Clostridium sp.]|nr:sigma-70 family RNA polymerase sigma factor [Clostridium sp.]
MLNKKQLSDDQLIAAYANGDNESFDILLYRHQANIYSYILKLVKNEDLANDFLQETFMKVISTIKQGRYVGDGHFTSWLGRIAHNLVFDYFRHDKSSSTLSTDEETGVLNRRELSEGTIEDAIIGDQILSDVQRLVGMLPEDQRAVVEMRFYEDLSFKEIAERTGVSINTALGRMRYALLNMRRRAKEANIELA